MNDASIFTSVTGRLLRYESDEYPVPKSSMATAAPSERSVPSVRPARPRSVSKPLGDLEGQRARRNTVSLHERQDQRGQVGVGNVVRSEFAGHDQRGALVAVGDQVEHQVGGLRVEGHVADLVDDDQRDAAEAAQLRLETPEALGIEQARHPLGRRGEGDAVPGEAGADAERDATSRSPGGARSSATTSWPRR
jgi:hypothetical protein